MSTRAIPIPEGATIDSPPAVAAPRSVPIPEGATIDAAQRAETLSPVHLAFVNGVGHSFGLTAPDPNNPHSLTLADAAKQFMGNLAQSAKASWNRVNFFTGEEKGLPGIGTPFSDVLVVPDMIASGIEGMSSMLESGGKDVVAGIAAKDHERTAQGAGKVIGALGQIFAGMEKNPASPVEMARTATEYAPREVSETQITGAARPANVLQGAINKSLGAAVRDVRFGDPSLAMVEEGLNNLSSNGRLAEVNIKLSQLAPQLDRALQNAKSSISLDGILDNVISKAKDKIRLSNESPATKQAAYNDLATLRDTEHEHAPSGIASASEANGFKQAIGDSVNWAQRPSPLIDQVLNAYKDVYAQVKDKVNEAIGPNAADLNRRLANLKAAQGALREQVLREKAGSTPGIEGMEVTRPLGAVKSAVGHVAPALINAAQEVAPAATQAAIAGGASIGAQLAAKKKQQTNAPDLPFHPGSGIPR